MCPHITQFNISVTAGFYSAVAGVMAGFAFSALFHLIRHGQLGQRDHFDLAAHALGAAFIALLFSCVSYAILAGEPQEGGRAASAEIFTGTGLGLATVQLIYAIVLLIQAHHPDATPYLRRFFQLVGRLICPLGFLLIAFGTTSYSEARHDRGGTVVEVTALALLCVVVVAAAVGRRPFAPPKGGLAAVMSPPNWAVVLSAVGILTTGIITARVGVCNTVPPLLIVPFLAVAAWAFLNQIWWFANPPKAPPECLSA
jgi:hypothetical protein